MEHIIKNMHLMMPSDTINNMSKKTLENIMIESGNYQIKQQETKIFAETMILYGSKEKKECKSNTEIL